MIKNALYYKDNYMKEFTSKVKEAFVEKNKIKVVLENTIFYPEGGGQPSDTGYIGDAYVLHVEEKNGKIFHIVDKTLKIGEEYNCKIDFEKRFQNMQNHTAEHIVSGIISSEFKKPNIGFHMSSDFVTLDFEIDITDEKLREIELKANEAVFKNIKVETDIYKYEDIKELNYRSKIELKDDVRIVKIKGYDICACCGIHVSKTGEIGIIKLIKFERYKKGIRMYMVAGKKALDYFNMLYKNANNISTILSRKIDEIEDGVNNLVLELNSRKKENYNLKLQMYDFEIEKLDKSESIIIKKDDLQNDEMKIYCNKLLEKIDKLSCVVSDNRFIVMSNCVNLKELFNKISANIKIKGGGSNNFYQGILQCEFKDFKNELNKIKLK